MDVYTLATPRMKHHWSSGLTIVCWMMITIPIPALAAPPVLHPGSLRYRDSSPPSIARAGRASLMARALVEKSGETTVEVSTSTLDTAAPAPGNISRLQIRLLDDQGRLRDLQSHSGLRAGGRLQFIVGGLERGLPLQLQASIEGIDSRRTEVVTVETRVRRRPDLAVQQLSAPESTSAGTPVMIAALVGELNGDTGAVADCVLRVDGAEVDRAPGIWVDAAGAVSCAFTHAFSSSGTHTLSVEAADVVPGDEDPTNNQATVSIRVIDWLRYHHEAEVDSGVWRTVARLDGWFTQSSIGARRRSQWFSDYENAGWRQTVQFRGEIPAEVSFPLTLFTLSQASGGEPLPGTTFQELLPEEGSPCVWATDPWSGGNLTLCAQAGQTSFTYTRYGGEVTYFSYWYQATWHTDMRTGATSFSDWSINSGDTISSGVERWAEGTSYDFDVQVFDGPTKYRATASVMLEPYEEQIHMPHACTGYTSPTYVTETCKHSDYQIQGVRGSYVSSDP
jgi:hypothetical protein